MYLFRKKIHLSFASGQRDLINFHFSRNINSFFFARIDYNYSSLVIINYGSFPLALVLDKLLENANNAKLIAFIRLSCSCNPTTFIPGNQEIYI